MKLESVLLPGVYRTKTEIAGLLGIAPRHVEKLIEEARKQGELPIMSSGEGYCLARTPEEYADNIESRRRRAVGQLVTVRGERGHLRRWQGRRVSQGVMPWA